MVLDRPALEQDPYKAMHKVEWKHVLVMHI
jgi:hypothetical protein